MLWCTIREEGQEKQQDGREDGGQRKEGREGGGQPGQLIRHKELPETHHAERRDEQVEQGLDEALAGGPDHDGVDEIKRKKRVPRWGRNKEVEEKSGRREM